MDKLIYVSIKDTNGSVMPEYCLETLYASDLNFEPYIRNSRIMPDGTAELHVKTNRICPLPVLTFPLIGRAPVWNSVPVA